MAKKKTPAKTYRNTDMGPHLKLNGLKVTPEAGLFAKTAPMAMQRHSGLGEKSVQHMSFLLWAMQDNHQRNMSGIARVVGRKPPTIRKWRITYRWEERAAFPAGQHWAVRLFPVLYPDMVLPALDKFPFLTALAKKLTEPKGGKEPPEGDAPEGTDIKPERKVPVPAPQQVQIAQQTSDMDIMRALVRGSLNTLVEQIRSKKVKATIKDLPPLVRTMMLINGDPTQIIADASGQAPPPESVRVKQARATGDPHELLVAIQHDLSEMSMMVDTMLTTDNERDNVVQFPEVAHDDASDG